jgi:ribosomal protein S18 acetylase RimI-like enzyme
MGPSKVFRALEPCAPGDALVARFDRRNPVTPLVRAFAAGDREAVLALWREVFGYTEARNHPEKTLDDKLAMNDGLLFVAVGEAGLMGTLLAGYDGHRGWLYRAAVLPRARRRGVGRALVESAEAALRARGCAKINLQTHVGNAAAEAFWNRLGYSTEPRVSMGKDLGGENDGGC